MVDFNKWEKESLTVIVWFMETKTKCKRHKSVANLRAHKLRAHASDIEKKKHLFSSLGRKHNSMEIQER